MSSPLVVSVWLVSGLWFGRSGNLVTLAGQVWLLTLVLGLGWAWIERRLRPAARQTRNAGLEAAGRTPFLDRLPANLGRDLLCLAMEDHYVRAHTRTGSTLILMRLRDAVAELEGCAGRQVHRSYWVAEGAIQRSERRGDSVRLHLTNGLVVPVSRRHLPELRAAGWFARESMGIA